MRLDIDLYIDIFSDNLWPVGVRLSSIHERYTHGKLYLEIVTGLILSPVVNEFDFQGPFLKLGQNIGLLVGAAFWGMGSDVWGRR